MGSDKKLHFVDSTGADSVLPFNGGNINKIVLTPLGGTALACALYHDDELLFTCPYYSWNYTLNQSNGFYNILCSQTYGDNFHITLQKSAKVNGTQRASGYAFNILRTSTQTVTLIFD